MADVTAASASTHPLPPPASAPESDDGLSDLDALADDDSTLAALQSSRLAELKAAASAPPNASSSSSSSPSHTTGGGGGGLSSNSSPFGTTLQAFGSEKAAMTAVAGAPLAVLLFTHEAFAVCGVMASHLSRLAALVGAASGRGAGGRAALGDDDGDGDGDNGERTASGRMRGQGFGQEQEQEQEHVLWLSLDAEKAPFLTERLRIRVLPCVMGYRAGEEVGRLVGFEGLGKKGQKAGGWTRVAAVLRSWGVLSRARLAGEEEEGDDDQGDSEESGEEDGEGVRAAARRNASSWIGGQKVNSKLSARGTSRATFDDEDDDWD